MKKEILFIAALSATTLFAQKQEEKSIQLEEVTVSSVRAGDKNPTAYNNLTREDITNDNAAKNIPLILQTLPSVVAFTEDGSGVGNTSLRIRGVDATRINVTLNGMPLNNPESQEVYWVNLPDISNALQSIQVQRGVGTAANGTASVGGSISLKTQGAHSEPYAESSTALGSYNTFLQSVAAGTGVFKNGLSADFRYSRVKGDGYIRNGKVDHTGFFGALSYQTKKDLLKFSYVHGTQHTGITWEGIDPEMLKTDRRYNPTGLYYDEVGNEYRYGNDTDNYYSDIFQLNYSRFINQYLTFNVNLDYNHGYGYYENYKTGRKLGSYYGLPNQTVDSVEYSKTDAIHRKLMDNDFYVGNFFFNYAKDKWNIIAGGTVSHYAGDHYGHILWAKYNENIPAGYEWYRNKSNKGDYNVFTKFEYAVTKQLNLFVDLQYRHIDYKMKGFDDDFASIDNTNVYNFFNHKLGLSFDLDKDGKFGQVYASWSSVSREPLREDLKSSIKWGGTQTIKPETLFDYELGYKINKEKWLFNANLYYMDYKDQMVQTGKLNDVGYKLMENVKDSYRYGVEVSAAVQPLNWLNISANVTFSQNKIKNYTAYIDKYEKIYDENGEWEDSEFIEQVSEFHKKTDISFSPDIVAAGIITFVPLKKLNISLVNKYVGEQFLDNTSNKDKKIDAYYVANLMAGYTFALKNKSEIGVQFFVNNLFNKKYVANGWAATDKFTDGTEAVYVGVFPQATRNYMAKVTLKF
ncbi:MAG: TonB-dependent receptor [Prevotellaceae bacterium]|jgi:iron complex outermembrane receptor protein|nr:TonB-dependent receptor [Prevotellaceae bacterium]